MKTNRRKYRTFSRHGDFLFTKREANKRNRKDAKKMLTNIAQYAIINISNEREVKNMRKLVYKVENKKGYIGNIKTFARAKEIAESIQGRITSYLVPVDESVATKKYVGKTPVTPYVPPYTK